MTMAHVEIGVSFGDPECPRTWIVSSGRSPKRNNRGAAVKKKINHPALPFWCVGEEVEGRLINIPDLQMTMGSSSDLVGIPSLIPCKGPFDQPPNPNSGSEFLGNAGYPLLLPAGLHLSRPEAR